MSTIEQLIQLRDEMKKSPITEEQIVANKQADIAARQAKFEAMTDNEICKYFEELGKKWAADKEIEEIINFCSEKKEEGEKAKDVLPSKFIESIEKYRDSMFEMQFSFTAPSAEQAAKWDQDLEELKNLLIELHDWLKFGKEF